MGTVNVSVRTRTVAVRVRRDNTRPHTRYSRPNNGSKSDTQRRLLTNLVTVEARYPSEPKGG